MTMTATAGTFSTNLYMFKCVMTSIHLVHLRQTAATFLLQGPSNHSTCAESQKWSAESRKWRTLSRTRHRTRWEIRSSLILTVQHLYLVSKITLRSALLVVKKQFESILKAILNVKTLCFLGFHRGFFLWLNKQRMTRRRDLENVKKCPHMNSMGQQESPTQCPTLTPRVDWTNLCLRG